MSDTDPANPRFPLFDSLRGIAALSIFVFHLPFAILLSAANPVRPYLFQLNAGVAVFFLCSGFLLYRPFARARLTGVPRPRLAAYAQRRALRIAPAYWVALPLVVLLIGKSGEATTATPVFTARGVVAYFGFLQGYDSSTLLGGISAAWTLCIEVAFYAMLPFWAKVMRRTSGGSPRAFLLTELAALAALAAIGLTWTSIAAVRTHPTSAVFLDVTTIEPWLYVLPGFLDYFALGMALAVISAVVAGRPNPPVVVGVIDRFPGVAWLGAALTFFALAHLGRWLPGSFGPQYIGTHVLQGAFAVALLLPAVFGDPRRGLVRKFLGNRVLLWVGLVSYGLYLWHAALISKGSELGLIKLLGSVGFAAVVLAASLLVAGASFYVVERPALRLGRRLSPRNVSQDADMRVRDLPRHERTSSE